MKLTAAGFTPAPNRIFCRTIEPEKKKDPMKKTESGLYIPEEAQGQSLDPKSIAEIISIGEDVKMPMNPGDTLYYYPHGGQLFTLEGAEYITLLESEVLGVFAKGGRMNKQETEKFIKSALDRKSFYENRISTTWEQKSPKDILDDLLNSVKGIDKKNLVVCFSPYDFQFLAVTAFNDVDKKPILAVFRDHIGFKEFTWSNMMEEINKEYHCYAVFDKTDIDSVRLFIGSSLT